MRKPDDTSNGRERGAVLVWTAGALVLLMGMAAFAVDLGWFYLNASRLQAAADAASLAGVVNLPSDPGGAHTKAVTASGANGFPIGADTSLSDAVLDDNAYEVSLTTSVDTFFLRVLGFDQIDVSRSAVAQYIKPVRLGSPSNTFGGPGDNFWAAINARYTETEQGDPFASECDDAPTGTGAPGCSDTSRPETPYRPGGYYYGIEVAPGSSNLTVSIYDPGHHLRWTGGDYAGGNSDPEDSSWRMRWSPRGVNLQAKLFPPDATPGNPIDNTVNSPAVCDRTWGTHINGSPSGGSRNSWDAFCTVANPTPGIWVLQLPSPDHEGSTKFGIRATTGSGPSPKVYGLLDMSLYVNFPSGVAEPYLAEVRPEHAGRTLEVDIWDLGDVDGAALIRFIPPPSVGSLPCTWTATGSRWGSTSGSSSICEVDISNQRFNAEWLNVEIPLPGSYSCDATSNTGCWWKLYIQANQAHDRTTWAARVTGDPVRLTR